MANIILTGSVMVVKLSAHTAILIIAIPNPKCNTQLCGCSGISSAVQLSYTDNEVSERHKNKEKE